nr:putative protein N(5)-glutamine methyltransferase [Motilibacter peucedani]
MARLRAAGCVFAEDEAALLTSAARDRDHLDALVDERVAGRPLEQVLGWVEFCGLRLAVAPGVFVPRRRTALLVERAAALVPAGGVLVDLCCGCGAVAAAVTARVPDLEVHAVDVDPVATACAAANLLGPGTVHTGDLYAPLPGRLRGRVDVVVCNAPYVPTAAIELMPREARDHEPRVALDGGRDGVDVQRRVAAGSRDWLVPGGSLLVETGEEQAPRTLRAFRDAGLVAHVVRSEELDATVVVGTPPTARGTASGSCAGSP